jgi:hypothetical protein
LAQKIGRNKIEVEVSFAQFGRTDIDWNIRLIEWKNLSPVAKSLIEIYGSNLGGQDMIYRIPKDLQPLKRWLRGKHVDVDHLCSVGRFDQVVVATAPADSNPDSHRAFSRDCEIGPANYRAWLYEFYIGFMGNVLIYHSTLFSEHFFAKTHTGYLRKLLVAKLATRAYRAVVVSLE